MPKRKKSDALPPRRSKRLRVKNGEAVEDSDIESLRVVESIEVEPKQTPLLALPPELRNRIYEYALQEPGNIPITESFVEPGLLSTNRQIRRETRDFYYSINKFVITIVDCDSSLLGKVYRSLGEEKACQSVFMSIAGRSNWPNVLAWCRRLYVNNCPAVGSTQMTEEEREEASQYGRPLEMTDVLSAATMMTNNFCRWSRRWRECEAALNILRATIGITNPEWLKD